MIIISDLSSSYVKKIAISEMAIIYGGYFSYQDSFRTKASTLEFPQVNSNKFASQNVMDNITIQQ